MVCSGVNEGGRPKEGGRDKRKGRRRKGMLSGDIVENERGRGGKGETERGERRML